MIESKFRNRLAELLSANEQLTVNKEINKNKVAELARKYDSELLNILQKDTEVKDHFFAATDGGLVFKKDVFLQFITNKEFLPDSYTKYKIKIGLGAEDGSLLSENGDVVLNWPYKDAVLEGGQDKEDQKRSEVFFNEVLAPDQITRLLDDKVFTNWKRHDKDGERELDTLRDDDNLVIKGNNLVVLNSLKKRYAGKIKLIYIDPPYNTGSDGFNYNDSFNHSTWLTFMKNRLEIAKSLLSPDGVIAVQSDYREDAYLKILLDEVFKRSSYIQTVTVKMSAASGPKMAHADRSIPKLTESIHVYCRQNFKVLKQPVEDKASWDSRYNTVLDNLPEDVGHELVDLMKRSDVTEAEAQEMHNKLKGVELISLGNFAKKYAVETDEEWCFENAWRIIVRDPNSALAKRLAALPNYGEQAVGCITNSRNKLSLYKGDANVPESRLIDLTLAGANLSTNLGNLWDESKMGRSITEEGGVALPGGKKPERLLRRILDMFTLPGDIVLDYHLGSGTTAAVAHKMGRQYIGIEQLYYGDNDPTVRLRNVIDGDQSGISKSVGWKSGGTFVTCNIMNNSNKFRRNIELAKNDSDYHRLLKEAISSSFLSYRVDPKKLDENEFRKLSSAEKRRLLLDLIDNNTLYVNYEDINDPSFKISDQDKEFNKKLYEKNS